MKKASFNYKFHKTTKNPKMAKSAGRGRPVRSVSGKGKFKK